MINFVLQHGNSPARRGILRAQPRGNSLLPRAARTVPHKPELHWSFPAHARKTASSAEHRPLLLAARMCARHADPGPVPPFHREDEIVDFVGMEHDVSVIPSMRRRRGCSCSAQEGLRRIRMWGCETSGREYVRGRRGQPNEVVLRGFVDAYLIAHSSQYSELEAPHLLDSPSRGGSGNLPTAGKYTRAVSRAREWCEARAVTARAGLRVRGLAGSCCSRRGGDSARVVVGETPHGRASGRRELGAYATSGAATIIAHAKAARTTLGLARLKTISKNAIREARRVGQRMVIPVRQWYCRAAEADGTGADERPACWRDAEVDVQKRWQATARRAASRRAETAAAAASCHRRTRPRRAAARASRRPKSPRERPPRGGAGPSEVGAGSKSERSRRRRQPLRVGEPRVELPRGGGLRGGRPAGAGFWPRSWTAPRRRRAGGPARPRRVRASSKPPRRRRR